MTEFTNLDNLIFQIADQTDKVSNISHQQKDIGKELRSQLISLRERRELVLRNRAEFTY